jgi:hypothetical protein
MRKNYEAMTLDEITKLDFHDIDVKGNMWTRPTRTELYAVAEKLGIVSNEVGEITRADLVKAIDEEIERSWTIRMCGLLY